MNAYVHPSAPLSGVVDPPSSKNYTTRFLLTSCLATGESLVVLPAVSEDAVAMVECARTLGARLDVLDANGRPVEFSVRNAERIASVRVAGFGTTPRLTRPDGTPDPDPEDPSVDVNPHNAGAVLRMLLGVGALLPAVCFVSDHPESLGKRPNRDLLEALAQIGVECEARDAEGLLPIRLRGGAARLQAALERQAEGLGPGATPRLRVSGAVSSQFVSSILFLAPMLGRSVEIEVTDGLRSKPLVETTVEVMRQGGAHLEAAPDSRWFRVEPGGYRARVWTVNGDWPGAAALLAAAAAVPGSAIALERLYDDLQGERLMLDILTRMGCTVSRERNDTRDVPRVRLEAPAPGRSLRGVSIDGDRCTDAVPALYAVAALARGETHIYGIRNLQYKECDRVREPLGELRRLYATLPDFQRPDGTPDTKALDQAIRWHPLDDPDEVFIAGCPDGFEGGIAVDGLGDHRVVMMLTVLGLRCRKGLTIRGAEAVAKSFPLWFETLDALGAATDRRP